MAHEELKKQYEEDCKNHNHPWSLWEFFYEPGGYWKQCIWPSPDWHPDTKYRRKEPPFQPEYFSGLDREKAIQYCGRKVGYSYDGLRWENGVLKLVDEAGTPFSIISTNTRSNFWVNYIKTIPETYTHPTNKNKKFKLHDAVLVYDRHRFAIPLKAEIVEFSSSNDGVRLLLHETNNPNYPKGCSTVWVHEAQLRKIDSLAHPTITIGGVKLPRPEHIEPFAGTHYFSVDNGNVVKRVWSACPYDMEKLMAGNVHRTESRAQEWADWWQKTVIDKLK
jgi:hypothetical protein